MGPIAPLQALPLAPAAALAFALAAALPTLPARAASVVRTAEVRAELLAHAPQGVLSGQPIWLGLQLEHAPDWHTYWKNPGDSGAATTIDWRLPQGVSAGEIDWPAPHRLPIGPLVNYGYEGKVLLAAPLFLPAGYSARTVDIALRADWLVCKVECLPQSGDFQISLPTGATPLASHHQVFDAASAARPAVIPAVAQARVEDGALLLAATGLPASLRGLQAQVFPEVPGVIEPAAPVAQTGPATRWTGRLPLATQRSASPRQLAVVLRFADRPPVRRDGSPASGPQERGGQQGQSLRRAQSGSRDAAMDAGVDERAARPRRWPCWPPSRAALLLNLMPCVFPVLSLKVLGSLATPATRAALLRRDALAYARGVLLSFLGAGRRAAGVARGRASSSAGASSSSRRRSSPAWRVLFIVIGLNLAGVFEVGAVLPALGAASARAPARGRRASLSGRARHRRRLPLHGAVHGRRARLRAGAAGDRRRCWCSPPWALGMALPYVVLCFVPAAHRAACRARRRGWIRFKQLRWRSRCYATVVWLVWVLGQQAGIDAAASLLAVLVAVARCGRGAWAHAGQRALTRGGSRARRLVAAAAARASGLRRSWRRARPRRAAPAGAGSPGRRSARAAALRRRAGRCSSTSPRPGASPARSTSASCCTARGAGRFRPARA